MTLQSTTGGAVSRTSPGGGALGEVLDRVLDKGIVIDAWAAVSLLGIEIVSIQAQVVVASVETYLKYAQAMSSLTVPRVEEQKGARSQMGAAEAEDALVRYLCEHSGGLRLEQLVEHFHIPRELVEAAVSHLVDEHKVHMDEARALLLPGRS